MILDADATIAATPAISPGRLAWAGLATVFTSVVTVHVVRLVALSIITIAPDGLPLPLWSFPVTADTVIFCGLGVVVFGAIDGFVDAHPVRTYRVVAFAALLVSFLPLLIISRGAFGGSLSVAMAVAAMHTAAYIPCVTLLPRLAVMKPINAGGAQETVA